MDRKRSATFPTMQNAKVLKGAIAVGDQRYLAVHGFGQELQPSKLGFANPTHDTSHVSCDAVAVL